MTQHESLPSQRKQYETPTVTRVHVDPVKELLQQTGCAFFQGSGNPACEANPGT